MSMNNAPDISVWNRNLSCPDFYMSDMSSISIIELNGKSSYSLINDWIIDPAN